MAVKRLPRAKPAPKRPAPKSILIRVEPDEDTPTYYVNHLEVGHSLHEFALNATRAPTVLSKNRRADAQESGELVVSPELQLIFSPLCAKALAGVLETQIAAYEKRFGQINKGANDE
jgi:hypothetical protein